MICPINPNQKAEMLLDYCGRSMEPARAAEFERHMEECAECRRLVEAQAAVWTALDGWTPAPVSPDFDVRLYARIAQEDAAPGWRKWLRRVFSPAVPVAIWKPAVPLAAACAVLVCGFLIRMPGPQNAGQQMRADKVDIEQVEKTLEDLDMLTPVSTKPGSV